MPRYRSTYGTSKYQYRSTYGTKYCGTVVAAAEDAILAAQSKRNKTISDSSV